MIAEFLEHPDCFERLASFSTKKSLYVGTLYKVVV